MSDDVPEWLISFDDLKLLHAEALAAHPGLPGIRDVGRVQNAPASALTSAMYLADDGVPNPLHVAAFLLRQIAMSQDFIDGNKRVAWLACQAQLEVCRVRCDVSQEDAAAFVLEVANERLPVENVVRWIADHIVTT